MEESLLSSGVDAPPHEMPTVASEGMLHAPMPQVMAQGAPVTTGATLSQAMDRPGVTMRQSMRAPFACLCCEPNYDYTIHDYAPTYDEGQYLPALFYIKEDSPYTHNGCPNRPCQHCLPGCKKTTYTTYTGDQVGNISASTTEDDAPQLPGIDPNNIIMTHSKGWSCGHSCGIGDKRFLCCCCLPYLETHDSAGKLLGSSKYICDLWCCVPKFAVKDEFGTEVYRVRPDTCCCGCCMKCVIGQAGGRCCSIPFKLRDPITREPVADAEVTELWAGIKKACCQRNNFAIKFPPNASDAVKSTILGLGLLIDITIFES